MYTYDAIGSYERTGYSCQGSGKDLMQPVLDNQLKAASPLLVPARVSLALFVPWCLMCRTPLAVCDVIKYFRQPVRCWCARG